MIKYYSVLIRFNDGSYTYRTIAGLHEYVDMFNNDEIVSIKKIGTYQHNIQNTQKVGS